MTRLLFRIVFGMVTVVIGSFTIVRLGVLATGRDHFTREASNYAKLIAEGYKALDEVPEGQLAARLATLKKRIGNEPLTLRKRSQLDLDRKAYQSLDRKRPVVWLRARRRTRVYLPLAGQTVLEIGPLARSRARDYPVGWVVFGISMLTGLIAFVLTVRIVRRLRRLEKVANQLAAGDLKARADVGGKDAITNLGKRFNLMADQLEQLLERQRQLLQAVSHELRTPVARIRFGIEMLEDDEGEKQAQRIVALNEDIDELEALVDELLLFVRMDGAARATDGVGQALNRTAVDVRETVELLVTRAAELHSELTVEVVVSHERESWQHALDSRLFRRAIDNLVSNACRYATKQVRVAVNVERGDQDVIVVVVEDDGAGIEEADRERIFEPFARLDESRSRDAGGVGLGLAIVRQVVTAHGGEVFVEQAASGGARFVTRWPAASVS
jgi:two-component system sensor histidine kinase RstB